MDVHHHTHASDPDIYRGRKKWFHYFWEFLMLFLAVTLGFFVENKREHNVEQKRAKDFAITLYSEIKKDTASLVEIRNRTDIAYHSLDTLLELMNERGIKNSSGSLYYHCGLGMYNSFFTANEATLQQMKSSGAIRYFQNYNLISAITEYEYNVRYIYQLETNLYMNFMEARKVQMKIFDVRHIYFAQAWDSSYATYMQKLVKIKDKIIPLLNYQPELVAEFRNWAQNRTELCRFKVKQYNHYLASAGKLLFILKREYHLE